MARKKGPGSQMKNGTANQVICIYSAISPLSFNLVSTPLQSHREKSYRGIQTKFNTIEHDLVTYTAKFEDFPIRCKL